MRTISWAKQARDDLQQIEAFISQDSPHYAGVVVARLIAATDRVARLPESGRIVPEWNLSDVREVIQGPYRVVTDWWAPASCTCSRCTKEHSPCRKHHRTREKVTLHACGSRLSAGR